MLTVLILCGFNQVSRAQLVGCAGTVPQVTATPFTATLPDDVVVNCDMLQNDLMGNTIKVIAYGRRFSAAPAGSGSAEAHVYAADWAGNSLIFNLPTGASRPDVVLASGTEPQPGQNPNYRVVVTYQVGMDAFYDVWQLNDCGLPTFNATPVTGKTGIKLNTSGNVCDTFHNGPHIDMWSDANNTDPITGLPTMHKFAIVWTQGAIPTGSPLPPIQAYDLYTWVEDLNISGSGAPLPLGPNAYMPDVACLTDVRTGDQKLELTYFDPQGGYAYPLYYSEYNYTTGAPIPVTSPPTQINLDGGEFFSPRIEAMSQYNSSASPAHIKWQVVASKGDISNVPIWQCWGYNDITGGSWLSDMYTTAADSDAKGPCVAAGISPALSSDIGNVQYTAGFYPRAKDSLFERAIYFGGTMDTRWWNVNCSPVTYHWDAARSMAVSNCSNSGYNLLSAWFDSTSIIYKESPNAMVFKSTGINSANPDAVRVYPNPAFDYLHINGAKGAAYSITDVAGKVLLKGSVSADGRVSVLHLSPGMYMLSIIGEQQMQKTIKFTRQ